MMNRYEEMKFQQVLGCALQNGSQQDYVCALIRSRKGEVSGRTVELTVRLLGMQGLRWLEVLQRQASSNFDLVFQVTKMEIVALPVLLNTANYQRNFNQLQHLTFMLFHQLKQNTQQLWFALLRLIKNQLYHAKKTLVNTNKNHLFAILKLINQMLSEFNGFIQTFLERQLAQEHQRYKDQFFTTGMQIYWVCAQLFGQCKNISLNKLEGRGFLQEYEGFLNFFNNCVLKNVFNYVRHYFDEVVDKNRLNLSHQLMVHALGCLNQLSSLSQFQSSFVDKNEQLVQLLTSYPILDINLQIQDQLNFQYGIIMQQMGHDLPSRYAQSVYVLCKNIPLLLRSCLQKITNVIDGKPEERIFCQMLIRLQVLHKIVIVRQDLVGDIMRPLIDRIFHADWFNCSIVTNCRSLRLLLFYGQILSEGQLAVLWDSVLQLFRTNESTTFAYHEADSIVELLMEQRQGDGRSRNRLQIMISERISRIIQTFLEIIQQTAMIDNQDRDKKMQALTKTVYSIVFNHQQQCIHLGVKMSGCVSIWLVDTVLRMWSHHISHSSLSFQLCKLLTLSVQLIEQDYVLDISTRIYEVLSFLKQPQNIDLVDQLLQLLGFVIQKEKSLSSQLVNIILSLRGVVDYNRGSISSISHVLNLLNKHEIVHHIVYQYAELPTFLASLYLPYLSLDPQQFLNYTEETQEICCYFQNFLQQYACILQQNQQLKRNILFQIRAMADNQWKCRFFLVIHHYSPRQCLTFDFYSSNLIYSIQMRGTFKLTFIYFIDKLLLNYNQEILNELIKFYRFFVQIREAKKLKSDPHYALLLPEIQARAYIKEGLTTLRLRRNVDPVELNFILTDLQLN